MNVRHDFDTTFTASLKASAAFLLPGIASALTKRASIKLTIAVIQGGKFGPGTPVDTGAARNSWTLFETAGGSPKPFTPKRSPDLDGAAAVALARQTAMESAPDVVRFSLATECPYMGRLEYGHSQQAPEGMIRVALTHWQEIVNEAWQETRAAARRRKAPEP